MRRLLRLAPFVLCVALYFPVLWQPLLSDDMAVTYALSEWMRHGEFWTKLWSKFAAGLDSPSYYYRPLTFLTFGVNFALSETRALSWHVVNLVGHLLAGTAVFSIASSLQSLRAASVSARSEAAPALIRSDATPASTSARSDAAPLAATSLFLLWGTNVEAVAWVSGRYDVLATALALWAAALYLRSRSPVDGRALKALACGVVALCSKESAAVLPGLIACFAWIRHEPLPFAARWKAIVIDVLPWIALLAAYFALRYAIFGSMFQVYPDARPLARIADGDWLSALSAAGPWINAALPSPRLLQFAGVLVAAMALACIAATIRTSSLRRITIGVALATMWTLALLLPHLSALSARGEGGRLFYTTSALLAIWLALPLFDLRHDSERATPKRLLRFVMSTLIATQIGLLHAALGDWRNAGEQMRQLVAALSTFEQTLGANRYAFVFAPDAIGAAPFARNANGAMVLPPIQPRPLLPRLLVFRPSESADIPPLVNRRLIPTLKTYPLEEVSKHLRDADAGEDPTTLWPTDVFCWRSQTSGLVRVELAEPWRDAAHWNAAIAGALQRAGCE